MREPTGNLRVLFLTLEFRHGTFSGNGVLAQSQAHGLAKAGHAVLVVSGCPDDLVVTNDAAAKMQREISKPGGPDAGEVEVRTLRVPASKWGKLTAQCPWRELADAAHADEPLHERIRSFAPDVVLGIDWHVTPTWRALRRRVLETDPNRNPGAAPPSSSHPPFVYGNYRVFSRDGDPTHASMERAAVEEAAAVVALCQVDADYLCEELAPAGTAVAPGVVIAPLREDVHALATTRTSTTQLATTQLATTQLATAKLDDDSRVDNSTSEAHLERVAPWRLDAVPGRATRFLLTCCVRLSPEKEPERFVSLCAELVRRGVVLGGDDPAGGGSDGGGTSERAEIVPVLCASTAGAYAESVRSRFLQITNGRGLVCRDFLDARGMERLYRRTILNVHPCAYDAYGMTVVEAAAFGAPSCVQRGDSVGCCALLSETGGEFVPADWTDEESSMDSIADAVEGYLRAGWDGARRGGGDDEDGIRSRDLKYDEDGIRSRDLKYDEDDSLRAIGARARRRAVGWDLLASGREIAKILTNAVRGESFPANQSRWTLPDATEQKRLAPSWRAASIAVWCDGAWRMIRSNVGDDDGIRTHDLEYSGDDDGGFSKRASPLPAGTYVVVTAHNPMGARADPASNDSSARALAASVRDMRPSPAAVLPTLSMDPGEGGFDAWNEPGVAAMLPETDPGAARTALIRLARRHGQAAVYELTCAPDGRMRIGVTPVFPGLEGLACGGVAAAGASPPASMPRSPP